MEGDDIHTSQTSVLIDVFWILFVAINKIGEFGGFICYD